jgi:hypothetical protein
MSRISEALRCCAMSDCEHCPYDAEIICPSTTELMNMAADEPERLDGIIDVLVKEDAE